MIDVAVIAFILYNTKGNRKIRDLAVAIGWSCRINIWLFCPYLVMLEEMNLTGVTYKYVLVQTFILLPVLAC